MKRLVEHDGVKGLTSNPSIFEKAIGTRDDYDGAARQGAPREHPIFRSPWRSMSGLRLATSKPPPISFRPVYDRLDGQDGYVSLEVSPYLAMDKPRGPSTEARRLWAAVNRPNLMIKVPGTKAGAAAIRQLIGERRQRQCDIAILDRLAYLEVAEAYSPGLRTVLKSKGEDIARKPSRREFLCQPHRYRDRQGDRGAGRRRGDAE